MAGLPPGTPSSLKHDPYRAFTARGKVTDPFIRLILNPRRNLMTDSMQSTTDETPKETARQIIERTPVDPNNGAETAWRSSARRYWDQMDQKQAQVRVLESEIKGIESSVHAYEQALLNRFEQRRQEQEAKRQHELRRQERAKVRIQQALETMSPEVVAELLAKQGVRKVGAPDITPVGILSQALEHINATFWVQRTEFSVSSWNSELPEDVKQSKHLELKLDQGRKTAVITGFCSIGALALARLVMDEDLADESEDMPGYAGLAQSDPSTRIAGAALARAIMEIGYESNSSSVWTFRNKYSSDPMETIIGWNDEDGRDKEEIVNTFERAIESPLAQTDEVWTIKKGGALLSHNLVLTQAEAEAFVALVNSDDHDDLSGELRHGEFGWFANGLLNVYGLGALQKQVSAELLFPIPTAA